ncbi:metallophosphoesterase family protein [Bosea sp. (in: a-proteobacteria)]|uniref:metallophosphoesterase family protein n=1 Tax=Bosea sp. (in: a-proteobacteria) TaxID=1871050 RepID=UPI002611B60F|nr:metallophosphoesterase family protein [Bosea sp. (in: a-proteobacteria)]MCO5090946.1 metallophosphatase family protein [Bosea sp. (in: a-proteobacteria)]
MRVGIVSDIHCNAAGLECALQAMGEIDELLCLGDSIYDYRFSNDVVSMLRRLNARTIQGNHEEGYFRRHYGGAPSNGAVDIELATWLGQKPDEIKVTIDGRSILMVHSTPWKPRGEYVYPSSAALRRFGTTDADVLLYGHTHVDMIRRVGPLLVINPGSAGEPRDRGQGPETTCAILETTTLEAQIIRCRMPMAGITRD